MEKDEYMRKEDLLKSPNPVYVQEQIDQMILTPEARATVIVKKKPNMVKVPIYLLDEDGEKVPIMEENEKVRIDEDGAVQYVIKDYEIIQDGWMAVQEIVPASEIFTIDNSTGNLSMEAVKLQTRGFWFYNFISIYQQATDNDYSLYLHKLRNDNLSLSNASKSYNGGTVQAIKTFINKTDTKQWLNPQEDEKKKGFNPLGMFMPVKKKSESKNDNKAAFSMV